MNRRIPVPLLTLGAAASLLTAAGALEPPASSTVAADNRFGWRLFQTLEKLDPAKNLFISPLSIAQALQMTYNGAKGQTQQDMARTLTLEDASPQRLNRDNQALLTSLSHADAKIQMSIANSVWYNTRYTVAPDFLQSVSSYYNALIAPLNGAGPINAWVSKQTHGRIPTIVQESDANPVATPAVLVNAVYFKGKWTKAFEKQQTLEQPFFLLRGGTTPCKMMRQSGDFPYFAGDGLQAVSLPYGAGKMSLIVLLPEKGRDFHQFLGGLSSVRWDQWMTKMQSHEGEVGLPRLKLTYDTRLRDQLSSLGMATAFDAKRADFTAMFPGQHVWIDDVIHKTFLEVNEEGTEAAAATAVVMRGMVTAVRIPSHPFRMIMDRPFVCAIRDNQSGALLFVGAIVHPTTG